MKDTKKIIDETPSSLYIYFRNDIEFATPSKNYASSQSDKDHYLEYSNGKTTKWMKEPVNTELNIKIVETIRVS